MKSQSIRVAVFSAFVLTSPLLIFAAGQPKLHTPGKSAIQDLSAAPRAVQQGKGGGMSRKQEVLPAPAESAAARPNSGDTAFRK
jgi:hypothetical protein